VARLSLHKFCICPWKEHSARHTSSMVAVQEFFNKYHDRTGRFSSGPGAAATGLSGPKVIDAEKSSHYAQRGDMRPVPESEIPALLQKDATSVRVVGKGIPVVEGQPVGIRANLNVKKITGVTVQTIHEGTEGQLKRGTGMFTGQAIGYRGAVELKDAQFSVSQKARADIASGRANKFPMASVDGRYRDKTPEEISFDGIEVSFNPMRHHLFVDPSGRPVKSAESATITGPKVYVRGKIEYFDRGDAPTPMEGIPTEVKLGTLFPAITSLVMKFQA
jgi:hypothetical protein